MKIELQIIGTKHCPLTGGMVSDQCTSPSHPIEKSIQSIAWQSARVPSGMIEQTAYNVKRGTY